MTRKTNAKKVAPPLEQPVVEVARPALPARPDGPLIADDRELLVRLGLGDAEAAAFLSKSRQALNQQLGPKGGSPDKRPRPFRLSEIGMLVNGALQLERHIDVAAVRYYVATSREGEFGSQSYTVLMRMLAGRSEELDLAGADTIVFLLPAFADLRAARGDVAMNLLHLAHRIPEGEAAPMVFLLSSTEMQARMAGQWLGIDNGANCFGRDLVDHYLPTVLLYRRNGDDARPYVLTERGTFEAAPRFRSTMMADCVRSMMPAELRAHLQPATA